MKFNRPRPEVFSGFYLHAHSENLWTQGTCRHDSVQLNFIVNNILQPINSKKLYVDLPGFLSPSIVTGDKYVPDLLLTTKDNCLKSLKNNKNKSKIRKRRRKTRQQKETRTETYIKRSHIQTIQ